MQLKPLTMGRGIENTIKRVSSAFVLFKTGLMFNAPGRMWGAWDSTQNMGRLTIG